MGLTFGGLCNNYICGLHLGVPVDLQGRGNDNFDFLVDKFVQRILSWSACLLSHSQRLILISSTLVSLASHIFFCLKISKGNCF